MRASLTLFACLALTGCIAGAQQARSSTTVTRDTGVPGLERTTYESTQSGSYIGGQMPIVMAGGYGHVMLGSGGFVHADERVAVYQSTVGQPVLIAPSGGGGTGTQSGRSGSESVDIADLEARIARVEDAVPLLAGAGILSLKQSCYVILDNPGKVPEAERATIVAGCEKVLKTKAQSSAKSGTSDKASPLGAFYATCVKVIEDPSVVADAKKREILTDICGTAMLHGLDSNEMLMALTKACTTIADDPELSGLAGADAVITECRKRNLLAKGA